MHSLATKCRGGRLAGHADRDFRETSGVALSTALKKRAVRSESDRMSHAKRRSPPEPEAIAATPDQIREAYLALTKTELARLASFARWRFQALGRRRQARDPDELVTDAFLAILDGTRTWYLPRRRSS